MTFSELYNNVRGRFNYKSLEVEFFRYAKANLADDILEMQKKQLFMLSQGKDTVQLGYYHKSKNAPRDARKPRKPVVGQPYDMIFTGRLESGIRVRITNSYIDITSNKRHSENIMNRPFWGTDNWFGLNPENLSKLTDGYFKNKMVNKVKSKILSGTW